MAPQPPDGPLRPPDLMEKKRHADSYKTHQESPSNSTYSSSNLQKDEAICVAISERELDGTHEINSHDKMKMIRANVEVDMDTTIQDLVPVKISADFNLPIDRSKFGDLSKIAVEASLLCTQVRTDSEPDKKDSFTGDSAPQLDEHLTSISSNLDRRNATEMNSGGDAGVQVSSEYINDLSRIDTGLKEGLEGRNMSTLMINNNSRIKDPN
ncbi:hypothetical protein KY290_033844 [Solanum tuberosum]|uniref:Uncharacterized protein n=1 Tax=Solanum tuberosum TaxID=4113 RepID=A0ABQ7U1I7_SOLTU|nr:hypothetical protein KY289_033220 [Solanum tuberosum]KAH0647857.1 hypothetical protein KY285_033105 [Solanum tuberosum]KAH0740801.1 hypothetical protein KY290_033844 [Solanum tuberosum]